jgi:L-lactate dehydrogenase complex protein LldG
MTSAREEILSRLATRHREADEPAVHGSARTFDDLSARFTRSLRAAKGEVRLVEDLAAAWSEVDAILDEVGAEAVVANGECPIDAMDLSRRWPQRQCHVAGTDGGDLRAACVRADVGLSGADAALAETGTVVVSSGPGRSRLVTLLPPVHVVMVAASKLTPDLFTWTASRGRGRGLAGRGSMPANIVLVSGPSKTADIEFTLTLGVHGPGRLVVVLYGE